MNSAYFESDFCAPFSFNLLQNSTHKATSISLLVFKDNRNSIRAFEIPSVCEVFPISPGPTEGLGQALQASDIRAVSFSSSFHLGKKRLETWYQMHTHTHTHF